MTFSRFYDLFQTDVDYESLLKPILPFLNKDKSILDAGCGSGHILKYLLEHQYDVVGIDKDESMLTLAQAKLDTLGMSNLLFIHDLRQPLKHKFHQIISLLDVFHYFKGIKMVAKNLYNALYDKGTLIIDLYQKPLTTKEEGMIHGMHYNWQVVTIDNKIYHTIEIDHKHTFQIKQYYYDVSYYMDILKAVGFKIQTTLGFDDRKIYLICTK